MTSPTPGSRRLRSVLGRLAAASALAAGVAVALPASPASADPTPISCAGTTIYISQGSPTQLYRLVISSGASGLSGSFAAVGSPSGVTFNAISYNVADSFLYGIRGNGNLVRIGGNGEIADLGAIAGSTQSWNNGAFLPDGRLAVRGNRSSVWLIDIGTMSATERTLTGPTFATSDFTYAEGFLWGLETESGQEGNRILRIDPTTGVTTGFVAPAVLDTVAAGAAWTFGNGNLGFANNNSPGTVYQVRVTDPASATPTFAVTASMPGQASSQNDGTACIGGPADLGVTKTAAVTGRPAGSQARPGDTIAWTVRVDNHGPSGSSGYTLTDVLPAGVTGASTTTPGCTITGSSLSCVLGELGDGDHSDVVVTATVTAGVGTDLVNTATVEGNEADPNGDNDTGSVTTPVVDLSSASDDSRATEAGVPVTFDPLDNDTPPSGPGTFDRTSVRLVDGNGDPVTQLTVPGEGTYEVDTTTGEITFTPEPGFIGPTTPVSYQVTDSLGEVVTAQIEITVTEVAGVPLTTPATAAAALLVVGAGVVVAHRRRTT